jgi:NAD(P)-dependent dehydrogenase (short-subunit alcohol dehydrogenase family)
MTFNPFSLKGKKILVTGASSGIGESISIECSKMNAELIITGRNSDRLNKTYNKLSGEAHQVVITDFTNVEQIDRLVHDLPSLDGIVLCAGVVKTLPVKNITESAINEVFQTNIISSIQLIKRLLKDKKINKGASIVFISSISTSNAKIGNSLYSASKGAVNSFSKVLALELSFQKIRVNSIQPGFIKSRILEGGMITEEQIHENISKYPLGEGKPEDIAYACLYLLSDAAQWVTGSIFTIDGGVTLKN